MNWSEESFRVLIKIRAKSLLHSSCRMSTVKILNESTGPSDPAISGPVLVTSLRNCLAELKANFIDDQGHVDYKKLRESQIFDRYQQLAKDLNFIDLVKAMNVAAQVEF